METLIICLACLSLGGIGGALIERQTIGYWYMKWSDWAILFWIPILAFSILARIYLHICDKNSPSKK